MLELIIASFIFGIISTILVIFVRNVTFIVRKHEVLLELQHESLVASSRLNADVTNSAEAVFRDDTGALSGGPPPPPTGLGGEGLSHIGEFVPGVAVGPGVVFALPTDSNGDQSLDTSGRLMWRSIVAYYLSDVDGVPVLVRKSVDLVPTSGVPDLPSLTDMHNDTTAATMYVAKHIVQFAGDPDPEAPFDFQFTARRLGVEGYGIEVRNTAFFRN